MRKIEFEKDSEKKKRRNQLILGMFLVFTMLFSTLGYAFQSFLGDYQNSNETETSSVQFNGFDFMEQNGFWILDFNGKNLIFRYNPSETFGIDFNSKGLGDYLSKPLYVYSESISAKSEIRSNLFGFVESIEEACPENVGNCSNPVKTCSDNFIIIKKSQNKDIKQEDNCVFIEGREEELTKLTDEFIYRILGVS